MGRITRSVTTVVAMLALAGGLRSAAAADQHQGAARPRAAPGRTPEPDPTKKPSKPKGSASNGGDGAGDGGGAASGGEEAAQEAIRLKEAIQLYVTKTLEKRPDAAGACKRGVAEKQQLPKVTLVFRADGQLACSIDSLSDRDLIDVVVLVPATISVVLPSDQNLDVAVASRYSVTVDPGERVSSMDLVRGDLSAAVKAAKELATLKAVSRSLTFGTDTEVALRDLGPFNAKDITVTVAYAPAGIEQKTQIKVEHRYPFNLTLLGVGGDSATNYSVKNGVITSSKESLAVDYFVGVQWYPFAWSHGHNGRYFVWAHDNYLNGRWYTRPLWWINLTGAFSVTSPTEHLFAGVGIQPVAGVGLVGGAQLRRVNDLKTGFSAGQTVGDSVDPIDKHWKAYWAVGINLDVTIASSIVDAFK